MKTVALLIPLFLVGWAPAVGENAVGSQPLPAEGWVKVEEATIKRRRDSAFFYSPEEKRFMAVGGQPSSGREAPDCYEDVALNTKEGKWENWFTKGKRFGSRFGPCTAPGFKRGVPFEDLEGNPRINNVYGFRIFYTYGAYVYAPDLKRTFFYSSGLTFSYDPTGRAWKDLAPENHPLKNQKGLLHWSSLCYDSDRKRVILFGGANVANERGDPGTWTYDPERNAWEKADVTVQPPQRANSQLVYDPVNKKVVLFGGDGLNRLYADTWTFDGARWEQKKPSLSPSARAGHALVWLPRARKVLLLGGYGYESKFSYGFKGVKQMPLDAWTYDAAGDRWEMLRRWDGDAAGRAPPNCQACPLRAAVGEDDLLAVLADRGYSGKDLWLGRLNVSRPDAAGTATHGVVPGTVVRRTGWLDPAWYAEGLSTPNRATIEAELETLPANTWVERQPPKKPAGNMDWGSAVYLAKHDAIARFSGGHCAYSGTAPTVYDISTGRYAMPFAPELPIDWNCADNGLRGATWTFTGHPWMGSHTWKHTASDALGEKLVLLRSRYTWFFEPGKKGWQRSTERYPFRHGETLTTLCTTPEGVACWAPSARGGYSQGEMWLLPPGKEAWKQLPVKGALPSMSPDQHGMAYDSKRHRLLLFSNTDRQNAGDVMAYDMKSGEAKWLGAAGKRQARVRMRETVYVPEHDLVMIAGLIRAADGRMLWLLYDCEKNAWFGASLAGKAHPIGNRGRDSRGAVFNNSLGLMHDSKRGLIWAVGQYSQVYVLRLDPRAARLVALE